MDPVPRFPLIGAGRRGLTLPAVCPCASHHWASCRAEQGRGRERHPTLSSVNEDQDDESQDDDGDQDDAGDWGDRIREG